MHVKEGPQHGNVLMTRTGFASLFGKPPSSRSIADHKRLSKEHDYVVVFLIYFLMQAS